MIYGNDGFAIGGGSSNTTAPVRDGFVAGPGGSSNKAPVNDGFVAGPGGSVKYKTRTGVAGETIYTFNKESTPRVLFMSLIRSK